MRGGVNGLRAGTLGVFSGDDGGQPYTPPSMHTAMRDMGGTVYNVVAYGAKGDGITDDTAAIQRCINASKAGTTILFPVGIYVVTQPIVYQPFRRYEGTGHALAGRSLVNTYTYAPPQAATIIQGNDANITTALFIPYVYANAPATPTWTSGAPSLGPPNDGPVAFVNLVFDGNYGIPGNIFTNQGANPMSNCSGLILMNDFAVVRDCYFKNMPGNMLVLTDTCLSGAILAHAGGGSSCTSPRILRNCFGDFFTDSGSNGANGTPGHGIYQIMNSNGANEDGFCVGNIIAFTQGDGIHFASAAGWQMNSNHLYRIQGNAMYLPDSIGLHVTDNYIEDFGRAGAAASTYYGIYVQVEGGFPPSFGVFVGTNSVSCPELSNTVTAYEYIHLEAQAGATDSYATVIGNQVLSQNGAGNSKSVGMHFLANSNTNFHVQDYANQISDTMAIPRITNRVSTGVMDGNGQLLPPFAEHFIPVVR